MNNLTREDVVKIILEEFPELKRQKPNEDAYLGLHRVSWAEGLISQLPKDHDGRCSWLLNYGKSDEAVELRAKRGIKFNEKTQSAETVGKKKEKTKKELYFQQYDKIADVRLRELCKERYDDSFHKTIPSDIRDSIYYGFQWGSKEDTEWWLEIYNRTDLETNPYIISDWEIESGKSYYTPRPDITDLYTEVVIFEYAYNLKQKGLLFRTPEEAIEMSKKILEFVKQKKK